jgi:alpha-D-ribose 1-methylphosphonate 5-triphosphate synthase subunit PhnH
LPRRRCNRPALFALCYRRWPDRAPCRGLPQRTHPNSYRWQRVALLTLADATTAVHLAGAADCEAVRDWVAFHTGAPLVVAEVADFAVGTWGALQAVTRFRIGEPASPDRSATLIVELDALTNGGAKLTGPGIETAIWLSLPEIAALAANRAQFPLGFDCLFTQGKQLAALPRSIRVELI